MFERASLQVANNTYNSDNGRCDIQYNQEKNDDDDDDDDDNNNIIN